GGGLADQFRGGKGRKSGKKRRHGLPQNEGRDGQNGHRENPCQGRFLSRQTSGQKYSQKSASYPAGTKRAATCQSTRPALAYETAVVRPKAPTERSEDPTALSVAMPLPSMIAGTMRKPPPIPKKPETRPTRRPVTTRRIAMDGLMRTEGSPSARRGRSMAAATAIITRPNRNNNLCPSTILPRVAPAAAPAIPEIANTA